MIFYTTLEEADSDATFTKVVKMSVTSYQLTNTWTIRSHHLNTFLGKTNHLSIRINKGMRLFHYFKFQLRSNFVSLTYRLSGWYLKLADKNDILFLLKLNQNLMKMLTLYHNVGIFKLEVKQHVTNTSTHHVRVNFNTSLSLNNESFQLTKLRVSKSCKKHSKCS